MQQPIESLQLRIEERSCVLGIIGLGYVGVPLAHAYVEAGFTVIGFDYDVSKINAYETGETYLSHLPDGVFDTLSSSDRFEATVDMARLDEPDVILVCVPTPLGPHNDPDLSYVESAGTAIGATLRAGQLAVLESTTFPGTTRDIFEPAMRAASGDDSLQCGRDFFVAYSPEREDPGSSHATVAVPKLVGGLDEASGALAVQIYESAFQEVVVVDRAEIAESAKLLENIFRSVNIALVNEMKTVLTDLDIDIWEVIDAAATKPFGFMQFTPGPGLGGHCIPIDPSYLLWKAREVNQNLQLIEIAGMVNTRMPNYVVERTMVGLNQHSKPMNGAKVLVVGLAYKPNVADIRESPSLELIELFEARGASVDYTDPHVPEHEGHSSVDLDEHVIESYDAIVISTAHAAVDFEPIARCAKLVVDTRNAMAQWEKDLAGRLIKA